MIRIVSMKYLYAFFLFGFTIPCCADQTQPNIVLILADDLGYSDLGCFGGEIRTPNLDRLADNGLRMTQLYNAARCCSTRASLLTGLYPHQAGVGAMSRDNHKPGYRGFLTDRCISVATLLKQSGYHTFMSGKWHLRGMGNPDCIPTNHGFDEFFGHYRAYASYYRPDLFVRLPENRPRRNDKQSEFYATDAITDHAIEFIRTSDNSNAPFFLYLAYNAPHFPLQAPSQVIDSYIDIYEKGWDELREARHAQMKTLGIIPGSSQLSPRGHVTKVPERNRDSPYYDRQIPAWSSLDIDRKKDLIRRMATYAAMVEIMDRNIGRIINDLKDRNQLENTLIVFLSDNGACAEWDPFGFDDNPYPKNRLYHGESLDQIGTKGTFHSYGTGWANACNTPFRLYKHYNHEGGISTPVIIHWPNGISRKGEIDRRPAHVIDLSATLLELGNAKYPKEFHGKKIVPLAGRSLLPVLANRPTMPRPIFFEHEGNRAVRLGEWKIVWTNYEKRWELYNIKSDRSELNDLSREYPEKVAKMSDMWLNWARANFVELKKLIQPSSGMPKIYYSKNQP